MGTSFLPWGARCRREEYGLGSSGEITDRKRIGGRKGIGDPEEMEGGNTQRKRELEDYRTKGNDTGKEKAVKKS